MKLGKREWIVLATAAFLVALACGSWYSFSAGMKLKLWRSVFGLPTFPSYMQPVKITGEVVDAWCYASQTMGPGRGQSHRPCAIACAAGGVTMGIIDEKTGDLYVAAKYIGFKGCQELLIPYIAKRVTVTGQVGEKGGCRILKIMHLEPASDSN